LISSKKPCCAAAKVAVFKAFLFKKAPYLPLTLRAPMLYKESGGQGRKYATGR